MAEFKYLDEQGVVVIAGKINDVKSEISTIKTTLEGNAKADAELAEKVFASVEYVSEDKKIVFKNEKGEEKGSIDATDFIKDGMVEKVEIVGGELIITFNTDSEQEEIKLSLTDIFDADNYYTKEEVDEELKNKQHVGNYVEYTPFEYKGEQRKSIVLNERDTISSMGANIAMVSTYEGLDFPVVEIGGQKAALVLNSNEEPVKVEVTENGKRTQYEVLTANNFKAISEEYINSLF